MFAVLLGTDQPKLAGTRTTEAAAQRLALKKAKADQLVILYSAKTNEYDFYYVESGELEAV